MLRAPENIVDYIDYDNGKLIISKDLPKELKKDVEEFKKRYEALHKVDTDLDYFSEY